MKHQAKNGNREHKTEAGARGPWLTPIILATQEAEIRRISVRSQPGKYFASPYLEKNPLVKRAVVSPEFKPKYQKKKKRKKD
jgi:hypothetical protein